jgi:hypothetical protein
MEVRDDFLPSLEKEFQESGSSLISAATFQKLPLRWYLI